MKRWHVYDHAALIRAIDAERVFVNPDGRLGFYNSRKEGERWGESVAGFAQGSWTHYVQVGPIG